MPVSRIERQGTAGYQCVVLRRCIVKVCKYLLNGLQPASIKLCSSLPVKFELADYQQLPVSGDLTQVTLVYLLNDMKICFKEEDALSMKSLKVRPQGDWVHMHVQNIVSSKLDQLLYTILQCSGLLHCALMEVSLSTI